MTDEINKDTLRSLVVAGGRPHILITVIDEETGACTVDSAGIESHQIAPALREIADMVDDDLSERDRAWSGSEMSDAAGTQGA